MAVVVKPMQNFGDVRGRDLFNRNIYQTVKATDLVTPMSLSHNFYGLTATGSAKGDNTQFELAKFSAVQAAGDDFTGSLDLYVNSGTTASATSAVAKLSTASAKFVSTTLSAEFDANHDVTFAKDTTAGVKQTFSSGGATTDVVLTATSDRLLVSAADTDVSGELGVLGNKINFTDTSVSSAAGRLLLSAANTDLSGDLVIQGDKLSWYQANLSDTKVSTAGTEYVYTHGSGTNSTGYIVNKLDPQNVTGAAMGAGGYNFVSYNDASAEEVVLSIGAGGTAGNQAVSISNANVGIGATPSASYKLAVAGPTSFVGDSTVTGDLTVTGDVNITGTLNTVNSEQILVEDKEIVLGSNQTNPTFLDGGGLKLGAVGDADQVSILYNYDADATKAAWDVNTNFNLLTAKSFYIAGGADPATDKGVTLSETKLQFGNAVAEIELGDGDLTLSKDLLYFGNPDAQIKFGAATTIDKNGISSASDDFAVYFGALRSFRIIMITEGTEKQLAIQYTPDGTVPDPVYTDKFVIGSV